MKLSLVIPCFNEADSVACFLDTALNTFSKANYDFELIFVNDGSRDDTLKNLKELYNQKKCNMQIISFSRNFGKEAAIYAGLKAARGDYITIIDADLQQHPDVAFKMVEFLDNNPEFDCVAAYQDKRKESGFMSFCKSVFYKLINKISDVDLFSDASDFRTMRSQVAREIINLPEAQRFSKGIFAWVGFNTHYMPYDVLERAHGESKWSFFKLFRYAIDGISAYTVRPLKFASFLGVSFLLLSIIWIVAMLVVSCTTLITPILYLAAFILLLCGVQLLCLGIIGSYLAKIYVQVKNRPIYIAKETIKDETKEN